MLPTEVRRGKLMKPDSKWLGAASQLNRDRHRPAASPLARSTHTQRAVQMLHPRRDQSGASAMAQAPRAAPCKHPRQRQQAPQTAAAAGGAPSHAFYVCTCAWCAAVAGTTPQPSPAGSPAENNSSWWRCLGRPSAGCSPAQASSAAALATRASSTTTRRGMEGLRTWLSHHHCPSRQAGSAGHAGNIRSQPPLCPHVCMYHVPTNATAMHA